MKNTREYYYKIVSINFRPAFEIVLKVKEYLVKGVC